MDNFDLKKFLVENKITYNSRILNEEADLQNFKKDYQHCMDSTCTFGKGSPQYDQFEDNPDSWDTYINNFKDIGLSLLYDPIRNEYIIKKSSR